MISIRPLGGPADVLTAATLFAEYAASLHVDLAFQGFDGEVAGLPGAYAAPAGALLLAEHAGEVIGCVALRPHAPPAIAELKRLYVRPGGRGLGAGAALCRAIIARARNAGYERIWLDTLPSMGHAQLLYRRLGFREIPAYGRDPAPGTIYMELDLRDPAGATGPGAGP